MKEIGGFIEIEKNSGSFYHNDAIALNCGRNCLRYLIQAKGIKKLKLPKFLCDSVQDVCICENVQIDYYNINLSFMPVDVQLAENEWIYVVNYYGQLTNENILACKEKYDRIILDNAQNYFQKPIQDIDTLYSCRKFFGVADGAFLYTDRHVEISDKDFSYARMNFLMGRFEKTASEFYSEYVNNNERFKYQPVKLMSSLTKNILCGLDYSRIENLRTRNYIYLHSRFEKLNILSLKIPMGAFMYPLYLNNGADIRKKLQKLNIYIPTLWPDVYKICQEGDLEYELAKNILPLPVDQRYNEKVMEYMANKIMEIVENE